MNDTPAAASAASGAEGGAAPSDFIRDFVAQDLDRITSYNVCYTKLLRLCRPHARESLLPLFASF